MTMPRWKVSGEYSKMNWCTIGNLRHGNRPFRRLPNISRSFITDSVSSKDWAIYRQYNFRSNTMQIYSPLKTMDSIFDSTPQNLFDLFSWHHFSRYRSLPKQEAIHPFVELYYLATTNQRDTSQFLNHRTPYSVTNYKSILHLLS